MEIIETGFEGLLEVQPRVFPDERGYFLETYRQTLHEDLGMKSDFVQDNQSFSHKNVVRGLHMQVAPYEQIKLVRVASGKILDVAVDVRKNSKTFGKWYSIILEASKGNMLFIPDGFVHGFAALEDSVVSYKCSNYYDKDCEEGVLWDDKDLNIDWTVSNPIISQKDLELNSFQELTDKYEF